MFRLVDRARTDQYRVSLVMKPLDFSTTRSIWRRWRRRPTRAVAGESWAIGGNRQHVAAIDFPQLAADPSPCRSCRPGFRSGEKVLNGDPRGLARGHGHLDALLCLDGLVNASRHFRPSANRPVNSSTMTISPSRTTYCRSRKYSRSTRIARSMY